MTVNFLHRGFHVPVLFAVQFLDQLLQLVLVLLRYFFFGDQVLLRLYGLCIILTDRRVYPFCEIFLFLAELFQVFLELDRL